MDTLIIYYNGTFINRQNGAHARAIELIRFAMSTAGKVIVYSYADHRACPWRPADIARFEREFPDVDLVLDRRGRLPRLVSLLKSRTLAFFPGLSSRLVPFRLPGLAPNYDALMSAHPDAPIIVNYAHGLIELNGVDPRRVTIETHDLNFLNAAKSLHRRLTAAKVMLSARVELELLGLASALIAIAPPEAAIFRLFYTGKPVFLVPAYDATVGRSGVEHDFRYDLLFVGSDNILNVDGLVHFLGEHRDWLSSRRMAIAGRVCMVDGVRAAAGPAIDLLGYVEDLPALMHGCKFLVSPVDGTGLKIKALEALAAGLPVFGSSGTLAGLPAGYQDCAFEIEERAMQALLDDDTVRQAAEHAALRYSRDLLDNRDFDTLRSHLAANRRAVDRPPAASAP